MNATDVDGDVERKGPLDQEAERSMGFISIVSE
jgi:hypothetical protein